MSALMSVLLATTLLGTPAASSDAHLHLKVEIWNQTTQQWVELPAGSYMPNNNPTLFRLSYVPPDNWVCNFAVATYTVTHITEDGVSTVVNPVVPPPNPMYVAPNDPGGSLHIEVTVTCTDPQRTLSDERTYVMN